MGKALSAVLLAPSACDKRDHPERPNVVMVVLDTVRRDRMSCYGYPRKTTPFLEDLSHRCAVYTNAYSTTCWTLPAHASFFTGLFAIAHGAHHEHLWLDSDIPTLAEILEDADYDTIGYSENPFVSPQTNLSRGFRQFTVRSSFEQPPTHTFLEQVLDAHQDRPFFCFMNLLSAHQPYQNAGPFLGRYLSDEAYATQYGYEFLEMLMKEELDKKWLRHLSEHYDATVRYADYCVEHMVRALEGKGQWGKTLFIVTSDHGENLGEHGLLEHQLCLYETLVRVPLLIHYPGEDGPQGEDPRLTQLTDLFPTVLRLAGVDLPARAHQAKCLLDAQAGLDEEGAFFENYRYPIFGDYATLPAAKLPPPEALNSPRMQRFDRRLKAVCHNGMKLIRGSDGRDELYDLSSDPQEIRNLAHEPSADKTRQALSERLEGLTARYRPESAPDRERREPLRQETIELLKSIGYV